METQIVEINSNHYLIPDGWQDVTLHEFEQYQRDIQSKTGSFGWKLTTKFNRLKREVAFWLKCPVDDLDLITKEDVKALHALITCRLEIPESIEPMIVFNHCGKAWKVSPRIANGGLDTPRGFAMNAIRDAQGKPMDPDQIKSLDILTIMQCQRSAIQSVTKVAAQMKQIQLLTDSKPEGQA